MRRFNTTGPCIPQRHYMVNIDDRVRRIRSMVEDGNYFCINRGRQYGKTTTLAALARALRDDYVVLSLDFQAIGNASFQSEGMFSQAFARILMDLNEFEGFPIPDSIMAELRRIDAADPDRITLDQLFRTFKRWILQEEKPLVLIVDEVDSATNNQVFLDFLAMLRQQYLAHAENPRVPSFQSVILAGVTDVRHLKSKIRDEDQHKVNSPWNIAVEFLVSMELDAAGIAGMLSEYEADHGTGMDIDAIAAYVYDYTHGYPFLVSRICQIVDQKLVADGFARLADAWTIRGIDEAVRRILCENNTLFDSLMGKLANHPELTEQLRAMLMRGDSIAWLPYDIEQQQLAMYGFVRNNHNKLAIANKIFEMLLYVHFVGESEHNEAFRLASATSPSTFVADDGGLDVPKILSHFIRAHNRIHQPEPDGKNARFLEEEARERFLTYLSPIINGTGTYDIEPQTRDHRRMDVVVHWRGRRYVIELKIWRGERYHAKGEEQIVGYMEHFGLSVGYLLSFDFRQRKEPGVRRVHLHGHIVYEGTV